MNNFHTHTIRCGHADGTDEEYVKHAIDAGFDKIGFSDHSPMIFPDGHISNFRMSVDKAEDYISSITALREKYKDKIKIYIGFEMEYYPKIFETNLQFLSQFDYDYLILGQHYVGNEFDRHSQYSGKKTRSVRLFERYVNQVIEGIKTGKFSYVAHPDVFNYIGSNKVYERLMRKLCLSLKELNCPIEFNLLGFSDKRHYPNSRFWQIASEIGNDVIIGFDAHNPNVLSDDKLYADAKAYLEKLKINTIDEIKGC